MNKSETANFRSGGIRGDGAANFYDAPSVSREEALLAIPHGNVDAQMIARQAVGRANAK